MAHNLNSMFYTGEKPWHGYGKKVDNALTSGDAINAAGLNWDVIKEQAFFQNKDNQSKFIEVPGHYITVRQDTMVPLGSVGEVYKVLQNKDAFSFFDAVVGVKEAMYQTAGSLGAGERIWLLAKLPGYIRTKGDDVTEKFLLLANSHDGTGAVQIMFTPIRVVCQNTLNLGIRESSNRVSLRHSGSMGTKIESIREDLGLINKRFQMLEEISQVFADKPFKSSDMKSYLMASEVVPNDNDMSTRAKNIIDEISKLFETGKGSDLTSAKGTLWGAFNSVVEYVDYNRGKDSENRAESLLFGSGARMKQRAFESALALVGK